MKRIIKLLHKSFDMKLKPSGQRILDNALKQNETLRKEKQKIETLRSMLAKPGPDEFTNDFTNSVMRQIYKEDIHETHFSLFKQFLKNFKLVAAASVALIIIALTTIIVINKSNQYKYIDEFVESVVVIEVDDFY